MVRPLDDPKTHIHLSGNVGRADICFHAKSFNGQLILVYVRILLHLIQLLTERSSRPSKKFLCISMGMLQIGALSLVGRLVEVPHF